MIETFDQWSMRRCPALWHNRREVVDEIMCLVREQKLLLLKAAQYGRWRTFDKSPCLTQMVMNLEKVVYPKKLYMVVTTPFWRRNGFTSSRLSSKLTPQFAIASVWDSNKGECYARRTLNVTKKKHHHITYEAWRAEQQWCCTITMLQLPLQLVFHRQALLSWNASYPNQCRRQTASQPESRSCYPHMGSRRRRIQRCFQVRCDVWKYDYVCMLFH